MIAKMPLQQNTTMTHIPYIDGLKGLCGIWICLFHYLLAFAPFGFIAFLPSLRFFQTGNVASIKRQACIRYFRLMPPVLACTLFGLCQLGLLAKNIDASVAGARWGAVLCHGADALYRFDVLFRLVFSRHAQ